MIEKTVEIKNKLGLHARPAAQFVKIAAKYDSSITVIKNGTEIDGKSIMGLMMLAAESGSQLILKIEGADEQDAMNELYQLIEAKFNEE